MWQNNSIIFPLCQLKLVVCNCVMCVWSCMMLHIFCPTICYDEIYQIIFIYHILIHNLHTTRSYLMGIFIYSCFLICYRNFVHFKHIAHLPTISYGIKLYIDFLKKSLLEENCVLFSMEGSIFLGQQYSFVSYDQIERTSQKYRRIEQASR